jgi:hypothetical protein
MGEARANRGVIRLLGGEDLCRASAACCLRRGCSAWAGPRWLVQWASIGMLCERCSALLRVI